MTFALVTGTAKSAHGTNPTTAAADTTGADLLIISIGWFNSGQSTTAPSVSDSKSNTWTALTVHNTGSNAGNVLFYAKNPTVGSGHTFTLTGTFSSICSAAFSGSDTSAPFDQQNGAGTASGISSKQPGSITPSVDNELVVVGGVTGTGGQPFTSAGSGYTTAVTDNGVSGNFASILGYKIQTTAGAENPTVTWTTNDQGAVSIASFKAAAAAGGFFSRYYYDMPAGSRGA